LEGDARMAKETTLLVIRLFLAVTFFVYGTIKILGGQFRYGDFLIDSRTTDGATLVWSFFGYSPVYGRFIGLLELVPAILLLFRRTRTVGALILLGVATNVTVMDFCFSLPVVKYFALVLTLLCAVLVAADYRKLQPLFQDERRLNVFDHDRLADAGDGARKMAALGYSVSLLFGLPAAFFVANLVAASVGSDPVDAAYTRCMQEGWNKDDLQLVRWSVTGWSGICRKGNVEFRVKGMLPQKTVRVAVSRPHSFVAWQASAPEVSATP
jgi:uncharacterized membrane protein YphA (DoxX/SURF4 family)